MLTLAQSFAVENKKVLLVAAALFILLAATSFPLFAGAANGVPLQGDFPFKRDVTDLEGGVEKIVSRIANVAGFVILAISVLMILWAAFLFLTAGAKPDNVTQARTTIIYALVGIVVALLAFALPTMVVRFFK